MASRKSSAVGRVEYRSVLDRVAGTVRDVLGGGRVPDQIPVLAGADPHAFGLAVATVEGEVHGVGSGAGDSRSRASPRCSRSPW